MRRLNAAVDRFAYNHPNFGISNLMSVIVAGNVLIYLLAAFAGGYPAVSFLSFSWFHICRGQLWRLVTFIFMPGYYSIRDMFWLAISLYFYYMIGAVLEREWGTAKFNLYYFSGVALTIVTGAVIGLLFGGSIIAGASYVNLSMFFAFAMLYPDMQMLLFFIIPVKIKWLAWLDAAIFAFNILASLARGRLLGAILPIVALLNFFVFFWTNIADEIDYRRGRARYQTSHQTIHFKSAVRQQKKKEEAQGYRRKCAVCGRTDTDYPDLEFRYCSHCAGYHCFCQDHIFNHVHFTE